MTANSCTLYCYLNEELLLLTRRLAQFGTYITILKSEKHQRSVTFKPATLPSK